MGKTRPEATIERFSALLAEGDLDAMMELYEPDAAFAPAERNQPRRAAAGRSLACPADHLSPLS